ncbi:AsmA-like C-terminal domain-containing protein [Candidatus Anaplasma sp. TIGMIC]|uniref:YhdP family protein n=1 Tax=Candidatus Anaplasma sp. TIGMIC TaxID=3020713 RepID=UPI00232B1E45|nr:AsmA-like C-terminal domain-containing protein [Candidatus Anaplasma sp. TIGMIC]MDB1135113.1 AsmA-like C-terminal domain-containing protein [Candidatus Anaplasma sp. TIGMIC]
MNSVVWLCVKLVFVLGVLLFGGILYYNVSTKDTLEFRSRLVNLYLEHKLSKFFFGADVNIRDVKLTWRRADENFFLSAQGVTVVDKDLGVNIEAPEVSIYSKIGILFLWGYWGDSRLDIAKIGVDISKSRSLANVAKIPISVATLREKLLVFVRSDIPVKVDRLVIRNGGVDEVVMESLKFGAENEYDGRVFSLEFVSGESAVRVRLSEHYKGVVSLHVKYNNFHTRLLRHLEFLDARLAQYKDLRLSGTADMVLDANDRIEYGDINLHSLVGTVPYGVGHGVDVQRFRARVKYSDGKLQVTNFNLFADNIAVKMSANLDTSSGRVDVNVGGYEVSAQRVCEYWPEDVYGVMRAWYCEHVLSGFFREPQIAYRGHINDFKNPDNYIVSSHLKDAVLLIGGGYGAVNIVDGGLLFHKGDLVIRSGDYNYKGLHSKEGIAIMKGVKSGNAVLKIEGKATSDAETLYEASDVRDMLNIGGEDVTGEAVTKFVVEVRNIMNDEEVSTSVSVQSNVRNMRANRILGSFDVEDVDLGVQYYDGSITVSAQGKMNDKDITVVATNGKGNDKIHCNIDGYISGKDLRRLSGAAVMLGISGHAKTHINLISNTSTGSSSIDGVLDVSTLSLGDQEGYFNLGEQKRTLTFSAGIEPGGLINVSKAVLHGDGVDVRLNGKIGAGEVDFVADKIEFLKTNAKGWVKAVNNNVVVRLQGAFLDLSKANLAAFTRGYSSAPGANNNVYISVQADQALMNDDVLIENLGFEFKRGDKRDTRVGITGNFAGDLEPFNISYGPIGLEVTTGNAGKFLRAINVLSTIDGGRLSIYMYPDSHVGRTNGMFSITKFNIVNAHILAQILTLSSLKGIGNTLSGSGIHFSKLNVPFTFGNDMISFSESWMEGVELGISLGGKIDLTTKNFDVRGQIVPAYAVNKMVWNTPFVGKLLTGGYSRGIVAIDYKVKGTTKVHDISVNFLSILAPNLLKRVLKVLDYKTKQEGVTGRHVPLGRDEAA